MSRAFALVSALLLSAPAVADPVTTVPFHLAGSTILLPVQIQSSDTLWFILDTGAYAGAVHQPRAGQLGLKFGGTGRAQGAAGTVEAQILVPFDLRLGSVVLRDVHYSAFPLAGIAPRMGQVVDGIVGSELFRRYVVEIDYAASTLRLYEPSDFHYGGRGERLPLSFTDNLPYIQARIDLSDGRALSGRYVVDTGSSQGVILLPAYSAQESVAATVTKTVTTTGQAVGGQTEARTGRLAALELGSLQLKRPLVSFSQGGPSHFAAHGNAGNVGGGVLKKFRVFFDYSRKEMILEPTGDLADPVPFDASGLMLSTVGAGFDTILVTRVLPESPASDAGLEPGDRLVSIDGKRAADVGVLRIRERLRRSGDRVQLSVSRGDRTWTVPLVLRDLL